jgi:hypothetical protein
MSDRLTLATAIEEAGIDRDKAVRIASLIWDAIHENVATKADLEATELRLNAKLDLVEHRLLTRLVGALVVVVGAAFAALHLWPMR